MRKNKLAFITAAILGFMNISCVETLIASYAYRSGKTRQAKEQFIASFNQTNLEREKAGLPPLDLCTEKYHFDQKWADDDPICAERIAKYEAGDKTALGHPQLEVKPEPTPGPQPTPGPVTSTQ